MHLKQYDIDSLDNRDMQKIHQFFRFCYKPLKRYFRAKVFGLDRIPPGAGLYVGNHSSGLLTPDSFIFGGALYQERGPSFLPYGLGHEWAISLPMIHQFIVPLGAVRASHENAHRLFQRGHKVIVYPGGDVDAMRPFRHRDRIIFDGRRGYIRLAIREGVPIIPVITAGSHATLVILDDMRWLASWLGMDRRFPRTHVWPLTLSIPWGLGLGPPLLYIPFPTRIWTEVLEPIRLDRSGPEAAGDEEFVDRCAEMVFDTMQGALTDLSARRAAAC